MKSAWSGLVTRLRPAFAPDEDRNAMAVLAGIGSMPELHPAFAPDEDRNLAAA